MNGKQVRWRDGALVAAVTVMVAACGQRTEAPAAPANATPDAASTARTELEARSAELERRETELLERERAMREREQAALQERESAPRIAPSPAPAAPTAPPRAARASAGARSSSDAGPGSAGTRNATAAGGTSVVAAPPPPPPKPVVLLAGTQLSIAFTSGISTRTAKIGDPVGARLIAPLSVDGRTVVPEGAEVRGSVTDVFSGSREIGGTPRLSVKFDALVLADGRRVPIEGELTQSGTRESGRDAAKIAGGAAVGTIVGNQADNRDRGRLIGGLVGAGIGAAIAKKTGGDLEIPDGASAGFTLTQPLELAAR